MKPKGFLLLSAIILIIIIGAASVIISHSFTASTESSALSNDRLYAQSTAAAGLQVAANALLNPNAAAADQATCTTLNQRYNAVNFENGQFSLQGTPYERSSAQLTNSMTSSSTIADVDSIAGYAPSGRIMIENEAMRYGSLSNSSAVCGKTPCFVGITRGLDDTIARSHDKKSTVTQSLCRVVSTGAIPTLANPMAEHKMVADVLSGASAYLVGRRKGSNYTLLQSNGTSWSKANIQDIPNSNEAADLNSIFGTDPQNIWAVGSESDNENSLFYYDAGTWKRATVANGLANSDLPINAYQSVSCASVNDCWAVGLYRSIIHWNGTRWTYDLNQVSSLSKNVQLKGVSCTSSSNCWAVGSTQFVGGPALFAHWNGATWTRLTTQTSNNNSPGINDNVYPLLLHSVDCVSASDCWAVGQNSGDDMGIIHYNGTQWKRQATDPKKFDRTLLEVTCVDANDCWAVGGRGGKGNKNRDTIFHYTGNVWTQVKLDKDLPYQNLYAVGCSDADDCFAVGDDHTVLHWDGSTWSNQSNGSSDLNSLNSIRLLGVIAFPKTIARMVDMRDL